MSTSIKLRIKEERKRAGFKTQDDAASACGIARESWSRYESGKMEPGIEILGCMARMGMDIHYILTGVSYERGLSLQEQMVLSAWHQASATAQKEAMAVLAGIGQLKPTFSQTFGSVGGVYQGDHHGDISIDMSGGKGRKK